MVTRLLLRMEAVPKMMESKPCSKAGTHVRACKRRYASALLGARRTALGLLHSINAPAGGKSPPQLPQLPGECVALLCGAHAAGAFSSEEGR